MSGRPIIVVLVAAGLLIILLHDLQGAGFAADRLKRIHELEAREAQLYERLAQKDAQRESQRRIYIDRIRKSESQLRGHTLETMALRGHSETGSRIVAVPLMSGD